MSVQFLASDKLEFSGTFLQSDYILGSHAAMACCRMPLGNVSGLGAEGSESGKGGLFLKNKSAAWARLCTLCAGVLLAGCAGQADGDATAWYNARDGVAPKATRIYICHGFGCTYKTPVDFSARDLRQLKSILATGSRSAAAERKAIARAVQWQENRVAGVVGSAGDIGGLDMQNAGVRGQMDCLDESTNTNSLLLVAETHGYLNHHRVTSPVARGFFLDGRYPHATATVKETKSGKLYAVDSWPDSNGKPPRISDLSIWMSRQSG